MPKALLLEDDPSHAEMVALALRLEGFDVVVCATIEQAEKKTLDETYDLLVIDIDLPDGSGLNFCGEYRSQDTQAAVVICSGSQDEESVLKGFELGADDYVRKPVGVRELLARLNRLVEGPKELRIGNLTVFPSKRRATWNGEEIPLTPGEFRLLVLFAASAGDFVSREKLLSHIDRDGDATSRAIDVHVSRLRKKLKAVGASGLGIDSEYGFGYRLQVPQ